MLEDVFTPYRFNNEYLVSQLDTIDADQADHIPHEGVKPPRWITGHICFTMAMAGRILGERVCPGFEPAWARYYSPGTDSTAVHDDAPDLVTLRDAIVGSEEKMIDLLSNAKLEDIQESHGIELLNSTPYKTKAHIIAHLLTTHYCFHLGELAIWRRTMGIPPLF